MRRLVPALLMLAACSPEAAEPAAERQLYAGEGRDRLCMTGERGGFIAYGKGDTNCSVRGPVNRAGEHLLTLLPDGGQDCRIDLHEQPGSIRLGNMAAGCAYYCGPGANYAGKAFAKNASASPAVDFAGDPLC